MTSGTTSFDRYARNLRRIFWAEFIDAQIRDMGQSTFRASLLQPIHDPDAEKPAPPVCLAHL